jgi:hypothetical protein
VPDDLVADEDVFLVSRDENRRIHGTGRIGSAHVVPFL